MTRSYKRNIGSCQHCGDTSGELHAAHLEGRCRRTIIDELLKASGSEDVRIEDVATFETAFRVQHEPLHETLLVLCAKCHEEYDASNATSVPAEVTDTPSSMTSSRVLPISFEPEGLEDFKAALLENGSAVIERHYVDGRITEHVWVASRFTEASNLLGNLRSRPEFRKGAWQERGLRAVHVRIED